MKLVQYSHNVVRIGSVLAFFAGAALIGSVLAFLRRAVLIGPADGITVQTRQPKMTARRLRPALLGRAHAA